MKSKTFSERGESAKYAQSAIEKYRLSLESKTDADLMDIVARERACRGWTSGRSFFLAALRVVCASRGVAYCWG